MKNALRFPSPALVIALIALFVALSGTTYAATREAKASTTVLAWHNVKLTNGWKYGAFGSSQPQWAIDSSAVVHLRGSIAKGTLGLPAFILPAAARPASTVYLPIYTSAATEGSLFIDTAGAVNPEGGSASGFSSLEGITFFH